MRIGGTLTSLSSVAAAAAAAPIHSSSQLHSPIPYLFGGLAAMLLLIAFAVLILACSSWKLSMFLDFNCEGSIRNGGDEKSKEGEESVRVICKEQIGVIMAGDVKPTYLAIPIPYLKNSVENRVDDGKPQEEEEIRVEADYRQTLEIPHHHHQTQ
ncbi:hypothetical protein MKW94_004913 [Papaver nudicaule]|uniref:Uncharacterized protein n=1 Tax=Papaver nudicaule TaxID=74823 RepID=A0AA41RYX4_PAPNU|nr:hypothetical protein [Papaver nudicaule]